MEKTGLVVDGVLKGRAPAGTRDVPRGLRVSCCQTAPVRLASLDAHRAPLMFANADNGAVPRDEWSLNSRFVWTTPVVLRADLIFLPVKARTDPVSFSDPVGVTAAMCEQQRKKQGVSEWC